MALELRQSLAPDGAGEIFERAVGRFRPVGHQQQQTEGDDDDEKERVIVDDRPHQRHLATTRREEAAFGQFVNAGDKKLRGNHQQDRAGDGKKFSQINFEAAFEKRHAQQDR